MYYSETIQIYSSLVGYCFEAYDFWFERRFDLSGFEGVPVYVPEEGMRPNGVLAALRLNAAQPLLRVFRHELQFINSIVIFGKLQCLVKKNEYFGEKLFPSEI